MQMTSLMRKISMTGIEMISWIMKKRKTIGKSMRIKAEPAHTPLQRSITLIIRQYTQEDIGVLIQIWNEVVEDGVAFPQEDYLDMETGKDFLILKAIPVWHKWMESSKDFIFSIPTISEDADIFVMQVLQFHRMCAVFISANNWSWIV